MRIAIACGGTGGHFIPGLTVGRRLRERGHTVDLWLSGRDVESAIGDHWDGRVISVRAAGFRQGFSFSAPFVALGLFRAFLECLSRMRGDSRPDVLLAMGSYASVGPVLAARVLRVPVVLHEANAVPGRAVVFLARFAKAVALNFRAASAHFPASAAVTVTGFPLRQELQARAGETREESELLSIMVMGGSQGSRKLNDIASQALCRMNANGVPVSVVHLTGRADEANIRALYEETGVPHKVFGFLSDMGMAYKSADLVIARAGAATCAEIAACAVPALMVPLPSARRDHQLANAREMEKTGGIDVIEERNFNVESLIQYLEACRQSRRKLADMRAALMRVPVSDGAESLAELVESAGREKED